MARCAADLAVLEQAAAGAQPPPPDVLRQTVHRLAGAAGTFGYAELSRLAGEVDDQLMEAGEARAPDLARLIEAVRALVETEGG